jgi:hypothetical protein
MLCIVYPLKTTRLGFGIYECQVVPVEPETASYLTLGVMDDFGGVETFSDSAFQALEFSFS